ncbi:hypothetical protein [Microvirga thermotolerans]|uniref:Uncharacterized protein n=1 Tax=Microvirga thermotolerans TaxID=2651334 RepID=A0A5P9JXT4_9HYPH|nr:hypothetical protein [Microvirga thermotolerans]QFU16568.1 hypothetical protein GDR74_10195 [Microvirga thermotolerans]
MKYTILAVTVSAAVFTGSASKADTTVELARCRAIGDSLQRLNCYDGLAPQQPPEPRAAESGYTKTDLTDLKVDREKMKGRSVEVAGRLQLVGEMLMLGSGDFDANPLFVEFKEVPRDQRRRVVEDCNLGCRATVRGKIGSVMFQTGVIAETIVLR